MHGGITRLIALLSSSGLLILNAWRAAVAALRSRISWVSQQVFLIDGTPAENLRLANPDASVQALWHALQQAHLALATASWARVVVCCQAVSASASPSHARC